MSRAIRAALCLSLALLAGCASVQRDVRYEAAPARAGAEAAELERSLALLRAKPDPRALAEARQALRAALGEERSDPLVIARLQALSADAALLAGDRRAALDHLAKSRAAYGGDELAALVDARAAAGPAERAALLEKSLEKADSARKLRAEYGSALLELGRYREALAALDAALPFLPEEYLSLYEPLRERAYALRDAAPSAAGAAAIDVGPASLSLGAMVALAQRDTDALAWLTGGASWATGILFDRLKAAGWFADPLARPDSIAARRDAALFLWRLMARGEPKGVRRYSERYAARARSPVPDVEYGSPYFDAVLGVVEAQVMQLPDGRAFDPEGTVSGLEFYGMLMEAAKFR